jgi:dTDP-4-dehydrorhamnose 3,5-epimerase
MTHDWVQDNHSRSRVAGCLRGLHYQLGRPQAKLVRATVGLGLGRRSGRSPRQPDLRPPASALNLTADNHRMLVAPRGFAHGFVVLSEVAEFQYKVDDFYAPEGERSVHWADPELAIRWPLPRRSRADSQRQGPHRAPWLAELAARPAPDHCEESPFS